MAQEFTINSSAIESKINQLLPSQGGAGAGIDFSASTMVIPIVDLTESAGGSGLRLDLQSSLSLTSVTAFSVNNATTTVINTTGYFRVFGSFAATSSTSSGIFGKINLTDGTTTKTLYNNTVLSGSTVRTNIENYDFIVLLQAGDSLTVQSSGSLVNMIGCTRQLADLSGNLVNP